jgi:hypothetical protein
MFISKMILTLSVLAFVNMPAEARHPKPSKQLSEFESIEMFVEQNATDGDTEVVISVTGGDDGFRLFNVRSPEGRVVVATYSLDPTIGGQRELAFESPEPPGAAILASYPEGIYRFYGETHRRERFAGEASLSHVLPPAPVILSPQEGASVATGPLLIQWSALTGVAQIIVELENESVDPEQSIQFNLPPAATSFEIPAAMLTAGSSYQLGIGSVSNNGNRVFVEVVFETE